MLLVTSTVYYSLIAIVKIIFILVSLIFLEPIVWTSTYYSIQGCYWQWDNRYLILKPKAFLQGGYNDGVLALKFIDLNNDFLRFTKDSCYAILYHLGNPMPKRYLSMGKIPLPSIIDYARDEAIDTALQLLGF